MKLNEMKPNRIQINPNRIQINPNRNSNQSKPQFKSIQINRNSFDKHLLLYLSLLSLSFFLIKLIKVLLT
jgi:hypothetical protein